MIMNDDIKIAIFNAKRTMTNNKLAEEIEKSINKDAIVDTWVHRQLFKELEDLLYKGENKFSPMHDMDKMRMYLLYKKSEAEEIHEATQSHHNRRTNKEDDLYEMALNWESHMYTSEEQRNAFWILQNQFNTPAMVRKMEPILLKLQIYRQFSAIGKVEDKYKEIIATGINTQDIVTDYRNFFNILR